VCVCVCACVCVCVCVCKNALKRKCIHVKEALTFSACPVTLAFMALSIAELKSLWPENYARQNTLKVIRLSHYKSA